MAIPGLTQHLIFCMTFLLDGSKEKDNPCCNKTILWVKLDLIVGRK